MKMRLLRTLVCLALGGVTGCTEAGYSRVTVAKMALISTPDNLSEDPDCQAWWGNIARAGMDMDKFSKDWNDVILDSATFLIENGCVQRIGR